MSWASFYIEKLKNNETISFRPRGNSMTGKISSGDLVTLEPIKESSILEKGNIVLCSVNGHHYLHLITAVKDGRYQISNNHGHVNGWCGLKQIFGVCVKVEP